MNDIILSFFLFSVWCGYTFLYVYCLYLERLVKETGRPWWFRIGRCD